MNEIKNLEPQVVWKNFHALTQVPRPSGHLEKVQQFLLDWAAAHGIEAFKDGGENIVMRKPATPGMENRKKAVMCRRKRQRAGIILRPTPLKPISTASG